MSRRILSVAVACFVLSATVVNAQDLAKQIIDHFPGKYDIKDGSGNPLGTVEWKVVAGGKAVAGVGKEAAGTETFHVAGWDPVTKQWIHTIFSEDGTRTINAVDSYRNKTYSGTYEVHNPDGTQDRGTATNEVKDDDHFVVTFKSKEKNEVVEMHFHRKK